MSTSTNDDFRPDADLDERRDEARALAHLHRDIGMNYDAGFGSLRWDSAAADAAGADREHRSIEE